MKKLSFIALLLASIGIFVGCQKEDTLKMGMASEFPPFEYKEGKNFKGIDIEITSEIARRMGKKIEFVDMEFDSVLSSLNSGNVDFSASGLTINEIRSKIVDFSTPYFNAAQVVVIRKNTFEDLKNVSDDRDALIALIDKKQKLKIGVLTGTTGSFYTKGDSNWGFKGFKNADVKNFVNGSVAFNALENKQIDIIILDEMPGRLLSKANGNTEVLSASLTDEKYGIAVKKGNKELLDSINIHLDAMRKDGSLDKIIAKYFSGN